jgi:two-component system chemotaxis response regulator CheB
MVARDIIVIGASAGGFDAIQKLVASFPSDLRAAIFITLHQYERNKGILPEVLNRIGSLPAQHPREEMPIELGHIYIAPPDYHLILTPGAVHLSHGPRENLQRPCINTMFRSAAAAYGDRVAGVLLTGLLDDGAAGLWDIQQHGGATIVQDPDEAAFRSMPDSAIRGLNVQYIVRLAEMAPLLARLSMGDQRRPIDQTTEEPTRHLTAQACPECGGAMTLQKMGRLKEYSCHVGHRFGVKTMIAEKTGVVERAIVTALSQNEELFDLLQSADGDLDEESAALIQKELVQRKREQEVLRGLLERSVLPSLD